MFNLFTSQMTGRDLLKDRSLKPMKIAESDIDVSEQRSRLTPQLPVAPRPRVGGFRQDLDGSDGTPRPCPFLIIPGPLQPVLAHRSN